MLTSITCLNQGYCTFDSSPLYLIKRGFTYNIPKALMRKSNIQLFFVRCMYRAADKGIKVRLAKRNIWDCCTLKRELSNSAWLTFRFPERVPLVVLEGEAVGVGLADKFPTPNEGDVPSGPSEFFLSSDGLRAPNKSKLNLASLSCSSKYGSADSFKLPITWRAISKAANCWNRKVN